MDTRSLQSFNPYRGTFSYSVTVEDYFDPTHSANYDDQMFCASSFKVFVVAAFLYYGERGELKNRDSNPPFKRLEDVMVSKVNIAEDDCSQGSHYINGKTGEYTLHQLLFGMIAVSDNTATDKLIGFIGVENIRLFLKDVLNFDPNKIIIPDSLKEFAKNISNDATVPLINPKETITCTASVFVKFYREAVSQTVSWLTSDYAKMLFKNYMSRSEAIGMLKVDPSVEIYMKGGMATLPQGCAGALCGAFFVRNDNGQEKTVCFSFLYNWQKEQGQGAFNNQVLLEDFLRTCQQFFRDNSLSEA
jgi:hypothetical protein